MNASLAAAALAAAALAVATAALVAGCSSSSSSSASAASSTPGSVSQYPVTVIAPDGAVTIKDRPVRIISLSPTATEDLYAVGAGRQVVAVDADSDYPSQAPVTWLSGLSPNVEAIAKYRPDLVITSQDTGGLRAHLKKLGVPVLIEPAAPSLDDAYAQIRQIGRATGHEAQAQQAVSSMKSQISADVKQAGSGHGDMTYYWELSAKPYYSVTSKTFIGQIVGLCRAGSVRAYRAGTCTLSTHSRGPMPPPSTPLEIIR